MAIRVVLAEDNLLVREGVRRLLETRKDAIIAKEINMHYSWRLFAYLAALLL